jgi:hypothetical protein
MVDPFRVIELKLGPDFAKLIEATHRQHGIDHNCINEPCLALDPGETTGVAEFDGDQTIRVYQILTQDIGQSYRWLKGYLDGLAVVNGRDLNNFGPFSHIRAEDYRVYEWKAQDHAWSPVHTIQWIGAIRVAADQAQIPLSLCLAKFAKGWWDDKKLDHFGLNPKGLKHGRDALRHLLYYLLFPTKAGQ